jgi:hypothetical protein
VSNYEQYFEFFILETKKFLLYTLYLYLEYKYPGKHKGAILQRYKYLLELLNPNITIGEMKKKIFIYTTVILADKNFTYSKAYYG